MTDSHGKTVRLRAVAFCAAVAMAASLAMPSMAWATTDDQKDVASEEEIAEALLNGDIKTELSGDDRRGEGVGLLSTTNKRIQTIYGATQYDTAAKEALHAYRSASYVIVASGESYVDALSATSLAGALDCPILLTEKGSLPAATAAALDQLGPSSIVVVGGSAVVSDDVKAQLGTYGSVERLYGTTQFDTQLDVYEYGAERGLWDSRGRVIVASGSAISGRFADALSASPVAFKLKAPVFLVDDEGDIPEVVQSALMLDGFKQAIIAGGDVVVSPKAEGFLQAATKNGGGKANVERLYGTTQYETSANVAKWAVDNGILKWEGAAIATGLFPYDALAGSVVQGKEGSVLVLADEGKTLAIDTLASQRVSTCKYFGGSALFTNAFKVQAAYRMGVPLYEIEGLVVYVDAGHGWDSSNNDVMDWGAVGSGYREFDLTKELANKVADVLRDTYNVRTYVNDDGGWYALRQTEARQMDAGVLVSIHFNSTSGYGASGTESYVHSYNAASGAETLQKKTHVALVSGLGLPDRGMFDEEFAVCGGKVPGVLLEVAFINNANDMAVYQSRKDIVAGKIAEGIAA